MSGYLLTRYFLPGGSAWATAKAAYPHFLTHRKDADPDIPILKETQEEYAKLAVAGEKCVKAYIGK